MESVCSKCFYDMHLKDCSFSPQTAGATSSTGQTPRGVDAVITAVIIGPGLVLFVCALMRAADCSDDSNSVKWVVLCLTK